MGEGDPKGDNYELVKNLVDIGPVDLEKIISKKCEKQREKPDKKKITVIEPLAQVSNSLLPFNY